MGRTRQLLAFFCLLLSACSPSESRLLVIIEADAEVAGRTARIVYEVRTAEGEVAIQENINVEERSLPIRRSIAPRGGDPTRVVRITALAIGQTGDVLTSARVIRSFSAGQSVEVRLRLYELCIGVTCPENLTCRPEAGRGVCVSAEVSETPDAGTDSMADAPVVITCAEGLNLCGETCTDRASDEANCGVCGRSCEANQICQSGLCSTVTCVSSTECGARNYCSPDLDQCVPGCDAASNCGSNSECDVPNNVCTCSTDHHTCSDRCVSNRDVATCGARCSPCPPINNAVSVGCDGQNCIATACAQGFAAPVSGLTCDDIDECSAANGGCGAARCVNAPGSFSCVCEAPNRTCGAVCAACPVDAQSAGTRCEGATCQIASCNPGFMVNGTGSACVPVGPTWQPFSLAMSRSLLTRPALTGLAGFGGSLAIDGNGQTLAVGDFNYGTSERGGVHVFQRSGQGTFALRQTIAGQSANVFFGGAVALSGPGLALLVGDKDQGDPGAMQIFTRTSTSGNFGSPQTIFGSVLDNDFGTSISVAYNDDVGVFVIGDRRFGGSGGGVVYVYGVSGLLQTLTGPTGSDRFGSAVQVSPDGLTLVVGDSGFNDQGRVYVYRRGNTGIGFNEIAQQIVGPAGSAQFGNAVAMTTDGLVLAIADWYREGRAPVYLYTRSQTSENFGAIVQTIESPESGSDAFGISVVFGPDSSSSPDLELWIGASQSDEGTGSGTGVVWAYTR